MGEGWISVVVVGCGVFEEWLVAGFKEGGAGGTELMLDRLPSEWVERLAAAVAPVEIARLELVCRALRDTLSTDAVWRAGHSHAPIWRGLG